MNIQPRYPTTPDEFLRWNEGREGKREFVRGRVEELMINVTRNHVEVASSLGALLRSRLDRSKFTIGSADFGVKTPDGVRFPDVFVDLKQSHSRGSDLAASEPLLVAEVLSASSYARDFVEKLADYSAISSLLHYLILSQDEPRAWLWSRAVDGAWPKKPQEIVGDKEAIELSGLGISVPMAELYAGIERRA
jgi:Uma2 family endonuclease